MRVPALVLFCTLLSPAANAQRLEPGFDIDEYTELLKVFGRFIDQPTPGMELPQSARFQRAYRSPVMGLDNQWELHTDGQGTAVISLRGTTQNAVSWLENAYAAMVPATGTLKLDSAFAFAYALADDPAATVHVGWLLGMGYLQRDILPRLDSLYRTGVKDVYIFGHSQGGALACLFTAHVLQQQRAGLIPADMRFKTYSSAGPKPGNLYFAYAYEHATRGGWAFNVVNRLDWVPEVPMSIQTINDFNKVNPFTDARKVIKQQPLVTRVALTHVYNKLDKPTRKAQRNYQKYLGRSAGGMVRKNLPYHEVPDFAASNNYVRCGATIALFPDSAYFGRFPNDPTRIFIHHLLEPYLYLAERYTPNAYPEQKSVPTAPTQRDPKADLIQQGIDLHAVGQEPFWSLDMDLEGSTVFRLADRKDAFVVPTVQPDRAADANVLRFRSTTERGELIVTVQEQVCADAMSGQEFPYRVEVEAKEFTSTTRYTGCGEFLPPVRLHDVWMLHNLNGRTLKPGDFSEHPRLEFFAAEGTVNGSSGCNRIGGSFTATYRGIRFGPLFTTEMACEGEAGRTEQAFMKAIQDRELSVSFAGNDLLLRHPDGTALVFRRVD